MSQYISVCRNDFTCFSCGREFQLPGSISKTSNASKIKVNKETAHRKTKPSIENNSICSTAPPEPSLIPSRKSKSKIQIIVDPPIEIEHISHESSDDDDNMIDGPNSGEETILAKSNINNNESNLESTKIESIDRFVKKIKLKTSFMKAVTVSNEC